MVKQKPGAYRAAPQGKSSYGLIYHVYSLVLNTCTKDDLALIRMSWFVSCLQAVSGIVILVYIPQGLKVILVFFKLSG